MTLRFEMQLLDELPMLFGASFVVHCLYTAKYSSKNRGYVIAILLTVICVIGTVLYLIKKEPMVFQLTFAVIVGAGVCISILHSYKQYSDLGVKFIVVVFVITSIAFLLWNIDNNYCGQLRNTRENVMKPSPLLRYLLPLTQLHGWWHVLSGYAFYLQIFACVQQRLLFLNIEHSADEKWLGLIKKIDVIDTNKLQKSVQFKD